MHFPTWVDLKGEDSVPETVHHVVVPVNPKSDRLWERLGKNRIRVRGIRRSQQTYFKGWLCCEVEPLFFDLSQTDEVHAKDNTRPGANSPGAVTFDLFVWSRKYVHVTQTTIQIYWTFWLYLSAVEMWSEAIKVLKGEYAVRAIKEHKMDQAIIFCRTKIDCDNMEQYFIQQGGGEAFWFGFFCHRLVFVFSHQRTNAKLLKFDSSHDKILFMIFLQVQTVKVTSFPAFVFTEIESPMRGKITWSASRWKSRNHCDLAFSTSY